MEMYCIGINGHYYRYDQTISGLDMNLVKKACGINHARIGKSELTLLYIKGDGDVYGQLIGVDRMFKLAHTTDSMEQMEMRFYRDMNRLVEQKKDGIPIILTSVWRGEDEFDWKELIDHPNKEE